MEIYYLIGAIAVVVLIVAHWALWKYWVKPMFNKHIENERLREQAQNQKIKSINEEHNT
ncbi:hypothetical protein V757_10275 [Pelistega indica]|uniref:Uncharacterized protein n=1 Tax=Pelistega indica TaxID=1414851 RepID=V8FVN7_9BURK|nr:hypothetical protein [Pelistega indica]ETD68339.1 hypothetical protein V757_10275 [Pelistega indica]